MLSIERIMSEVPKTLEEYFALDKTERALVSEKTLNGLIEYDMAEFALSQGGSFLLRGLRYRTACYMSSLTEDQRRMIYEACKVSAPTASNYAPASPASNSSAAPTASNSAPAPTASNSSASDRDGITALLHTKYGKRRGYMPVTRMTFEYASDTTHLLDGFKRDFTPLLDGDVDLRDINLDGIHKVTRFDEIDRDAIVSFLKQIQLEQSTPVSAPPSNMSAASAPVSNMSAASATGFDLLAKRGFDLLAKSDEDSRKYIDECQATHLTPEAMKIKEELNNRLQTRHFNMTYEKAAENVLEYRLDSSTIRFDEIVALIEDMYLRPRNFNSSTSNSSASFGMRYEEMCRFKRETCLMSTSEKEAWLLENSDTVRHMIANCENNIVGDADKAIYAFMHGDNTHS